MEYPITMDARPVGRACVERQGLYYRITATCKVPNKRLRISCGEMQKDLGVLVPDGTVTARIAVRELGEGTLAFEAFSPNRGEFYPIDPEKPFEHLQKLPDARFAVENGQPGIAFGSVQS